MRHSQSSQLETFWLLCVSIFFYSCFGIINLFILVGSILFNYGIGLIIRHGKNNPRVPHSLSQWATAIGIGINILILCVFKYSHFLVGHFNLFFWFGRFSDIHVPVGMSFVTFVQIAYLVDIYRNEGNEICAHTLQDYLLFVVFFPKIMSGPIMRISEFLPQLDNIKISNIFFNLSVGVPIFFIGLFKKVVVADGLVRFIDPPFNAVTLGPSPSTISLWNAGILYTFQLYFDFSGYSDVAIGLGKMLGFDLPINFNSPYKARSIVDFWRRWHITLSDFLRDFIFIPLSVHSARNLWIYASLLLTMVLAGMWHGLGWTFLVWGGLHGIYLCICYGWTSMSQSWERNEFMNKLEAFLARIITFLAVVVAWVVFRSSDLKTAGHMLKEMFMLKYVPSVQGFYWATSCSLLIAASLLVVVCFFPNTQEIMGIAFQKNRTDTSPRSLKWWQWKPTFTWSLLTAGLILVVVVNISGLTPFIYFRF